MIPLRRNLAVAVLAVMATLAILALGSCSKNDLMGAGLDRTIIPKGASPVGEFGNPDSAWKWAVNSIDSVVFTDDIDSTTLEVTSFQALDFRGKVVPGTVRFMPSNAYIHYNQDFPSSSYAFHIAQRADGKFELAPTIGKVYFIPSQPLSGHRSYYYLLTTGVRLASGHLRRDGYMWSFTTGDSVAPPDPVWP